MSDENVITMVYGTIKVAEGRAPKHTDELIVGNNLAKTLKKSVGDSVII